MSFHNTINHALDFWDNKTFLDEKQMMDICSQRIFLRAYTFIRYKNNENATKIINDITYAFGNITKTIDLRTIQRWCLNFKSQLFQIFDFHRIGRPSLFDDEVGKICHDLITENRKITC